MVWTARAQGGTSRSHTSNIVPAKLAERVWCTKFQSSLLDIYFRLSGFQPSILLIYFCDGPNRCSHSTKVSLWHPIWYGFLGSAKAIPYSVNRGAFIEGECKGVEVGKEENWVFFSRARFARILAEFVQKTEHGTGRLTDLENKNYLRVDVN